MGKLRRPVSRARLTSCRPELVCLDPWEEAYPSYLAHFLPLRWGLAMVNYHPSESVIPHWLSGCYTSRLSGTRTCCRSCGTIWMLHVGNRWSLATWSKKHVHWLGSSRGRHFGETVGRCAVYHSPSTFTPHSGWHSDEKTLFSWCFAGKTFRRLQAVRH